MATFSERVGDIFDSPPNSILIRSPSLFPIYTQPTNSLLRCLQHKGILGRRRRRRLQEIRKHDPCPILQITSIHPPLQSPSAFHLQKAHCNNPSPPSTSHATHQRSLVGTCLLIPPFPTIETSTGKISPTLSKPTPQQEAKRFWIACLFTSAGYGKKVDTPASILAATETAVADLARQIADHMNKRRKIAELKERREKLIDQDDDDDDERLRALTALIDLEEKESGGEMGGCYSVRINSGLFGVPWKETRRVLKEGDVNMIVVRPSSQKDEVVESDDDGGVEVGEAQEEKKVVRVDSAVGHKEGKVEAREGGAGAEKADNAQVKRGLKRKIGEGGGEEEGKKKEVGGRQTKLKFGKGK
ncbi:MAG: hypothetical protein Q9172_001326 [Xanthocarpia lactea]